MNREKNIARFEAVHDTYIVWTNRPYPSSDSSSLMRSKRSLLFKDQLLLPGMIQIAFYL